MKTTILLVAVLFFASAPLKAQYQFQLMEDDFLQIGAGNYFIHVDKEAEVKKTVSSVFKAHRFPTQDLLFNKDKNLYFASYYVNPSDDPLCIYRSRRSRPRRLRPLFLVLPEHPDASFRIRGGQRLTSIGL